MDDCKKNKGFFSNVGILFEVSEHWVDDGVKCSHKLAPVFIATAGDVDSLGADDVKRLASTFMAHYYGALSIYNPDGLRCRKRGSDTYAGVDTFYVCTVDEYEKALFGYHASDDFKRFVTAKGFDERPDWIPPKGKI